MKKGFTLIELMVVISIISLLASIITTSFQNARNKAYMGRAMEEFHSIYTALTLYQLDNNSYPPDTARGLEPSGLGKYLAGGWPASGPWPGSVYDWDTWADTDPITGLPTTVYQISIRFCDINGANCNYPSESWAQYFNYNSSVYYCISGPCKAHQPPLSPIPWGYCVDCNDTEPSQR